MQFLSHRSCIKFRTCSKLDATSARQKLPVSTGLATSCNFGATQIASTKIARVNGPSDVVTAVSYHRSQNPMRLIAFSSHFSLKTCTLPACKPCTPRSPPSPPPGLTQCWLFVSRNPPPPPLPPSLNVGSLFLKIFVAKTHSKQYFMEEGGVCGICSFLDSVTN